MKGREKEKKKPQIILPLLSKDKNKVLHCMLRERIKIVQNRSEMYLILKGLGRERRENKIFHDGNQVTLKCSGYEIIAPQRE